jgi:hypothetical protein
MDTNLTFASATEGVLEWQFNRGDDTFFNILTRSSLPIVPVLVDMTTFTYFSETMEIFCCVFTKSSLLQSFCYSCSVAPTFKKPYKIWFVLFE